MNAVPRRILLSPGPVTTTDTVKAALVVSDICPREDEFGRVIAAVRCKLLKIADANPESHTAILIGGPGTAAVEATIGSLVPPDGRILIIDNGAYGARATEITAELDVPSAIWHLSWTSQPSPAELAARLDGPGGPFTHLFWVHHETTTGLLNPIAAFCKLCAERGVTSIVDTMSSFGGLPLSVRDDGIDFVISSANKCLQGMPGISFVIGPTEAIARSVNVHRNYALNLLRHWHAQERDRQFPFTPPVQILYALDLALDETMAETVSARTARYRACSDIVLAGMRELGFEALLPDELHSGLLTAFRLPGWRGFTFIDFHDFLYAHGITLYPGKLPRAETFRVANLGALSPDDVGTFLTVTRQYLATIGIGTSKTSAKSQRKPEPHHNLRKNGPMKC